MSVRCTTIFNQMLFWRVWQRWGYGLVTSFHGQYNCCPLPLNSVTTPLAISSPGPSGTEDIQQNISLYINSINILLLVPSLDNIHIIVPNSDNIDLIVFRVRTISLFRVRTISISLFRVRTISISLFRVRTISI